MWVPVLDGEQPTYLSLVRALQLAIETGVLQANDQLPPQRELAYALKINLSTVTRAFNEATTRGLVAGERGRGTYVLPASKAARLFASNSADSRLVDLSMIVPRLQDNVLQSIIGDLGQSELRSSMMYASHAAILMAEDAARSWLRWRGLKSSHHDSIVLCAGAQAALAALLAFHVKPGQSVMTEMYTFPGLKALARVNDIKLEALDMDTKGILPSSLDQVSKSTGSKVLVSVPNLQNPTGTVMDAQRRTEITKVIERRGITLIEDDIYGSFTDQPPLISNLKGNHFCISSLSKCIAPGLRFGFIAGSVDALAPIRAEVGLTSWMMSPLMQIAACNLMRTGRAQELALAQAMLLRNRWRIVEGVFGATDKPVSTHLWLNVDQDPDQFCDDLMRQGVKVLSSSYFATGRRKERFVRASVGANISDGAFADALATLRRCGATL